MAANEYHFITRWRVQAALEEVSEILQDAPGLARWWPSVYLAVEQLESGDEHGLGKVVSLYTKGWLPYTLRWQFRVTEVRRDGFSLEAWGDFVGRGIWTYRQDGPWLDVIYDWNINAEKPLLRYFSFLLKPIFAANHRWAMRKGEESLRLELARRHAATPQERDLIPPPPQATSPLPLLAGAALACLAGGWLVRKLANRGSPPVPTANPAPAATQPYD